MKHTYLVKDAEELPRVMTEALWVAQSGRPGPVLVDVCVDQWAREVADYDGPAAARDARLPPARRPPAIPRQLAAAARVLAGAKRPMIYAGGGIIAGEAHEELTRLAELTGIPVTTTLMGLGGFPGSHPL